MPHADIDPIDRLAIYENMTRYAWSLDRADGNGVADTFTADGVIEVRGRVYENRDGMLEFVRQASSRDGFFGRQHHVQPLFVENTPDGYLVTAYWMVVTWHAEKPPFIVSLGYYRDKYVKDGNAWLCREKVISHWNDQTTPPRAPQA